MIDRQTAYKRKIKKELYFAGSLSCADLSFLTEKSLPITTRVLNELIEEGEVVETGYANSTGGRRPQIYALKADLMYVVSVAMDQLITRIVLINMQNDFVGEVKKVELPLNNNPRSCMRFSGNNDEISIPFIALPNPFDKFSISS